MIKSFLYVEDGSVDVDALEDSLGEETRIIIYRQGSKPPILEQPKEPIKTVFDEVLDKKNRAIERAKYMLTCAFRLDMPDEVRERLESAYNELD